MAVVAAVVVLAATAAAAGYQILRSDPVPRIQVREGDSTQVLIVGDSYVTGTPSNDGPEWPEQLHDEYGWTITTDATGGVGYLRDSLTGGPYSTEVGRLVELDLDPDVVLLEGGLNDIIFPSKSLEDEVVTLVEELSAEWPDARFVILTPFAPRPAYHSGEHIEAIERAGRRVGARVVDVSDWFLDGPDGLIGADRVHPSDEGHQMLADRLGLVLSEELGE